ncbi:MAG: HAMP domain-containing histidine kinase [Chloroflexota bacterium]|nr:HAMP domain-containing histidine kinase [Chloroflexota bacterium]
MFKSLRSRLIASFVLIVFITLFTAGLALFARLGGYRDQLTASTLREVGAPIYYNLTLFAPGQTANGGQKLRNDLVAYLSAQQRDSHVTVLLIDRYGRVIPESTTDTSLLNERFDVLPPPARGPNFRTLPEQKRRTSDGRQILYVTIPMPRAVRLAPTGVSEIVVAAPEATPGSIFRDVAPRLLFAGLVGLGAATLVGIVLWASLYRPLGRVTRGIRAVAGGRYKERVPVSGPSEVRALAEDVNAMADSVQASQRTLRQFLGNVSHELKTPLTSIRGFAQAMTDGTLDTPDERARAARVIDIESRRLLHMVEELLDLTRIESGQQRMALADVRVNELLSQIRDVFAIRAADAGVTLAIEPPADDVTVVADFDRIEQVLGNLVDNAFHHTREGGRIEAGVRRPGGGTVELYVADNGSGIPPQDLPHIFDRFYRGSGEASGSGNGLGLAIAREIVRAHGGEIRVEPQAGGGTVFTLTLPTGAAGQQAPPRQAADAGDDPRLRVRDEPGAAAPGG